MRPIVIKVGGELLINKKIKQKILRDLVKWHRRHSVVFVHGGGPQIKAGLDRQKIKMKFLNGRRVTSSQAMNVVEEVLSGTVNKDIVAALHKKGVLAVGISGRDGGIITAKPIPKMGRSGSPVKINTRLIQKLNREKILTVFSTVGSDSKGQALNVNADDAASALAVALKASKIIYLTNVLGVLDQNKKRIPVLKNSQIQSLIRKKVIVGGMVAKVQSAQKALKKGVGEIQIVNGEKGISPQFGTRIVKR